MNKLIEDKNICFYCGESMVNDEDKLYCPVKGRIVKDDETCEECNT